MELSRNVILLAILVLAELTLIECSETNEMGPLKEIPDDPLFQDKAAFCEGCYALVNEMEKLMTMWVKEKGSIEDHIDTALLTTCTTARLRSYVLSPPKMVRLCSGIRAHYMDQIGMAVLRHYSKRDAPTNEQLFTNVCRKAIPACPKGVTPMSVARQESRKKAAAEKEETKTASTEGKKETKSVKKTIKVTSGEKVEL